MIAFAIAGWLLAAILCLLLVVALGGNADLARENRALRAAQHPGARRPVLVVVPDDARELDGWDDAIARDMAERWDD